MLRQWMKNGEPLRGEVGLHLENAQVTFAFCVVILHSPVRVNRLFSMPKREARNPMLYPLELRALTYLRGTFDFGALGIPLKDSL